MTAATRTPFYWTIPPAYAILSKAARVIVGTLAGAIMPPAIMAIDRRDAIRLCANNHRPCRAATAFNPDHALR
jgi:hypothetical protein